MPMQITLDQEEISAAVEAYARSQINIAEGQTITVDFSNGRGGAIAVSASLAIRTGSLLSTTSNAAAQAPAQPAPAAAGATTKPSPFKPKAVPAAEPEAEPETDEAPDETVADDVIETTEDAPEAEPEAESEPAAEETVSEEQPAAPKPTLFNKKKMDGEAEAASGEDAPKPKSVFSKKTA